MANGSDQGYQSTSGTPLQDETRGYSPVSPADVADVNLPTTSTWPGETGDTAQHGAGYKLSPLPKMKRRGAKRRLEGAAETPVSPAPSTPGMERILMAMTAMEQGMAALRTEVTSLRTEVAQLRETVGAQGEDARAYAEHFQGEASRAMLFLGDVLGSRQDKMRQASSILQSLLTPAVSEPGNN